MAATVSNQAIANALQIMGLIPPGPIDPSVLVGAQHSEFMQRMMEQHNLDSATFSNAEQIAIQFAKSPPQSTADVTKIIQQYQPDAPSLKAGIQVDPATGAISVTPPTLTPGTTGAPQPGAPAPAAVPPPSTSGELPQGPGAPKVPEGSKFWPVPQGSGPAPSQTAPAAAAGQAPPTSTPAVTAPGTPGGKVTAQKPVSDSDMDAYFKQNFGSDAWFMDIPEVKKAVEDTINKGGTAADGLHAAESTNWWKTTAGSARSFQATQAGDPATANAKIDAQVTYFQTQAAKQGFTLDPDRARKLATNSLMFGWTPEQIAGGLGAEYQYHTGQSPVAGVAKDLKSAATDMLIPLSDDTISKWGQQIVAGTSSLDEFKSYAAEMAKSMYPGLTNAIDRGITVAQYVQPYQQLAGKELDMNPDSIDMTDPKWSGALNQIDPKTGERQVQSLAEFQSTLRQMPDWQYTQTAHSQVSQMTDQLATDFGMK